MQLFRRAATRAASSSQLASARPIAARTTPFILRSNRSATISPLCRRWNSTAPEKSIDQVNTSQILEENRGEASAVETEAPTTTETEVNELNSNFDRRVVEEAPASADAYDAASISQAVKSTGQGSSGSRRLHFGERYPELEPSKRIYVGNLIFEATSAQLRELFEPFGKVADASIKTDIRGLSKGFGFVTFEDVESSVKAVEAMHRQTWEGRDLVVNYVLPSKEPKPSPPSRTLFIGNISFEVSDEDLNQLFRTIKNCVDVRVAVDRRTGQPRGFAHADFIDTKSAVRGYEELKDKMLYGRKLKVDYAAESYRRSARDPSRRRERNYDDRQSEEY